MHAEWKDVSSFSQRDTDRSPRTFQLRVGNLRIVITKWIHGDPTRWYVLCPEVRLTSHRELTSRAITRAQREAIAFVEKIVRSDLLELSKLLPSPKQKQKAIPYLEDRELEILLHAVGIQKCSGKYNVGGYRNHFCPGDGDDLPTCAGLVEKGFMGKVKVSFVEGDTYMLTPAGKAALRLAGFKIKEEKT